MVGEPVFPITANGRSLQFISSAPVPYSVQPVRPASRLGGNVKPASLIFPAVEIGIGPMCGLNGELLETSESAAVASPIGVAVIRSVSPIEIAACASRFDAEGSSLPACSCVASRPVSLPNPLDCSSPRRVEIFRSFEAVAKYEL